MNPQSPSAVPAAILLLVAPDSAGDLAKTIVAAGWQAIPARSGNTLDRQFLGSGATVALVDGRGVFEAGLAAVKALAGVVEADGGALLLLMDGADVGALDRVFAAGATHYLHEPFDAVELARMLGFAARHVGRLRRGARGGAGRRHGETGLPDIAFVRRWLDRRIADRTQTSILFVSPSRFEVVATVHGREIAERLNVMIADRVGTIVGRRGIVAHLEGADYVVLVDPEPSLERIKLLGLEIADAISKPFVIDDVHMVFGCHVGGTHVEPGDAGGLDVLRRASIALASARLEESGTVRLLSGAQAIAVTRETRLATDLSRAIERDEVEVLFQPQVDLATGTIVGVEALARWRHPEHGELGANTLFASAERAGFLLPLSVHVQAKAMRIAAGWGAPLDRLRLSVNVTSADIARPAFAAGLLAMAMKAGFPPDRLTAEVTESGLIKDLPAAAAALAFLQEAGCRIAIDDFGTGYASLGYVKALPLDYLKIDKLLISDVACVERDHLLVRGIIGMARALGLIVIAEGVEDEAQRALLAAEGCDLYQGFLCSEPVNARQLEALISGHQ
ncbi:EAL domain-containing protein (putative c-di-GMP-specific phosphodiesterase class I)/GGDEF domain-containing protein [Sphingomonas zeicaulis]|uniref:EAL domain-containing protein n=1 Tax=Sphingomonas zeicaulis TaxID=1632740 RepID=UPI003D19755B